MTVFNHSESGTLSFIGNAIKTVSRNMSAAALSFAGNIPTRTTSSTSKTQGAVSFAGSIPNKFISRVSAIIGTLSFVGNLKRFITTNALTAATFSFVGAFTKQAQTFKTANLAFIGVTALPWFIIYVLSSTLSFAGNTTKFTTRSLPSANLAFIGNTVRRAIKILPSATFSFLGNFFKQAQPVKSANLSFVGIPIPLYAIVYLISSNLGLSGNTTKALTRSLPAAALGLIGGFQKLTLKRAFTAAMSFAGVIPFRFIVHTMAGVLTSSGVIPFRAISKNIAQGLRFFTSFTAGLITPTTANLTATLSFSGSIANTRSIVLNAILGFVGLFLSDKLQITGTFEYPGGSGNFQRLLPSAPAITGGWRLALPNNQYLDIPAGYDIYTNRGWKAPNHLVIEPTYIVVYLPATPSINFTPLGTVNPVSLSMQTTQRFLVSSVTEISETRLDLTIPSGSVDEAVHTDPLNVACVLLNDPTCDTTFILPFTVV